MELTANFFENFGPVERGRASNFNGLRPKRRSRSKFPGGGSQGLESMIQARDDIAHP